MDLTAHPKNSGLPPRPRHMVENVFERRFSFRPEKVERVWTALNRRETFTRGQIFPYRVEFESESPDGPFEPGEFNIHHGPLLSLPGHVTEISANYRGLQYHYGAYVVSFRWIRPVSLEFWREDGGLRMRLCCHIHPRARFLMNAINAAFWPLFRIGF